MSCAYASIGLSGLIQFNERGTRHGGLRYTVKNFNENVYSQGSSSDAPFVVIGNWSQEIGFRTCERSGSEDCHVVQYNTDDNSIPTDHVPFKGQTAPQIIRIAAFFEPFSATRAGFMRQHLAAFLMALNEINNKTDGIADNLLPNSRIVFVLKSTEGLIGPEAAAEDTMIKNFDDAGAKIMHQ